MVKNAIEPKRTCWSTAMTHWLFDSCNVLDLVVRPSLIWNITALTQHPKPRYITKTIKNKVTLVTTRLECF
jgi:hypothetical protein